MRVLFVVHDRLLGEFDSPSSWNIHRIFYCSDCGGVFAKVLSTLPAKYFYSSEKCGCTKTPWESLTYEATDLRTPYEMAHEFEPIEVLAEELLIELNRLPEEILCPSPQESLTLPP